MVAEIWAEKYRPKTLDEYVWRDPAMRTKAEEWLADGGLPHLLLSGLPGTGKTSLIELLLKMLEIPEGDIIRINAGRERKVEDIQYKVENFVNSWALGPTGMKYVLFEEMDGLSTTSQKTLKADMETYSDLTRILATTNHERKIIPEIRSRFETVKFSVLEKDDFVVRAGEVLATENIDFDLDTLNSYVRITYPDLRNCIGLLSKNSIGGKLRPPSSDDDEIKDYIINTVELFKKGKYLEARKLIVAQAQPEEYPDLYRFLYRNLDLFGKTQEQQDDALLVVRKAVVHHSNVFDPEINLSAALVELTRIAKT